MPNRPLDFVPPTEESLEKQPKYDLFILYMQKIMKDDGSFAMVYNYYKKEVKWSKSGGYDIYRKHITS